MCDFDICICSGRHRPREFQLLLGQKVCHYLGGDKGGRGSRQTVTNGDKGGGGVKNRDFYGDILFEWPLSVAIFILQFVI